MLQVTPVPCAYINVFDSHALDFKSPRSTTLYLLTEGLEVRTSRLAACHISITVIPITRIGPQQHDQDETKRMSESAKPEYHTLNGRSLLELPPEIRGLIYGFVLSTPYTSSDNQRLSPITAADADERRALARELDQARRDLSALPVNCKKGSKSKWARLSKDVEEIEATLDPTEPYKTPLPLDMAILRTCKEICEEVSAYILRKVPMRSCVLCYGSFNDREICLLMEAKKVYVEYWQAEGWREQLDTDLRLPVSWGAQLTQVLQDRPKLIHHFELLGVDDRSMEDIFEEAVNRGCGSLEYDLRYVEIILLLRKLPQIAVKNSLKISWDGEDKLPRHYWLLNEYWSIIKGLNIRAAS